MVILAKKKEHIFLELFKCIDKELIRSIFKENISLLTIKTISGLYYGYLYYYYALQEFDNVKIAFVGYDILFPVGLSLALESKGIKTIGTQERLMTHFVNEDCYILDTQFTISNYVSSLMQSKPASFFIKNYIPIGLIRSDKLIKSEPKENTIRKRILIFDYHVENNFNFQISSPVLNWSNDLFFRKELIKLAKDFKDYDFIVRGKNIEWTRIPYFKNIIDQWKNAPNITIDADYSEFYRSYNLCNKSDLIIARQTSIADECISKGYDVIIHDYGINYDCFASSYYPKIPGINFCHSYKELKEYLNTQFSNNNKTSASKLSLPPNLNIFATMNHFGNIHCCI